MNSICFNLNIKILILSDDNPHSMLKHIQKLQPLFPNTSKANVTVTILFFNDY